MHNNFERTENLAHHSVIAYFMNYGIRGNHNRRDNYTQDKCQSFGNNQIWIILYGKGKNNQHRTTENEGAKNHFIMGNPVAKTAVDKRTNE